MLPHPWAYLQNFLLHKKKWHVARWGQSGCRPAPARHRGHSLLNTCCSFRTKAFLDSGKGHLQQGWNNGLLVVLPRDRAVFWWGVCSQHRSTLFSGHTASLGRAAHPISSSFSQHKQTHLLSLTFPCLQPQAAAINGSHIRHRLAEITRDQKSQSPHFSVFIRGFTDKSPLARLSCFAPTLPKPVRLQSSHGTRAFQHTNTQDPTSPPGWKGTWLMVRAPLGASFTQNKL